MKLLLKSCLVLLSSCLLIFLAIPKEASAATIQCNDTPAYNWTYDVVICQDKYFDCSCPGNEIPTCSPQPATELWVCTTDGPSTNCQSGGGNYADSCRVREAQSCSCAPDPNPTQASLLPSSSSGTVPFAQALTWACTNGGTIISSSGDNGFSPTGTSGGQTLNFATAGTYPFSITCDKNGQSSTASATVEAQLPPPPVINVTVISPADYATPGSYSWTVTGGPSTYCNVYTSENTGGNGGPFLTEPLTSSKTITGYCSGPGGLGPTDTEIIAVNPPVALNACSTSNITTTSALVRGSGGYGNYSWSVSSGSISPGTTSNGGSVTLQGSAGASYSVVVRDQAGQENSCNVTLASIPSPVVACVRNTNPAVVGQNISFSATKSGGTGSGVTWSGDASGSGENISSQFSFGPHSVTANYEGASNACSFFVYNPVTCSLGPVSNMSVTAGASGGDGDYIWKTSGKISLDGTGSAASITFTAPGNYIIEVASNDGALTGTCSVKVDPPPLTCEPLNQTVAGNLASINAVGGFGNLSWAVQSGQEGTVSPTTGTSTNLTGKAGNIYVVSVTDQASQTAQCSVAFSAVTPPPTLTITATSNPIPYGSSTNIRWDSTNAQTCNLNGGDWKAPKGEGYSTGPLTRNITINGACTGPGGTCGDMATASGCATLTVVVSPPPALSACTVSNITTVSANIAGNGGFGNLQWSISEGVGGSLSNANGRGTTLIGKPGNTYTLTVTDEASQSASCSAALNVPNPTVTLTANPTAVSDNATTTLTWSSTNATVCTATQGPGFDTGRSTSGSDASTALTYAGGPTYIFTIVCTGSSVVSDSREVIVNPTGVNATLTANPVSVTSGGITTLTWSSNGATACTAGANSLGFDTGNATAGSDATTALTANTTFTVSCTGPGGTANASASVTVLIPSPTVTLAVNPTTVSDNATTTLTWSSTNATVCTATQGPGFDTRGFADGITSSSPLKFSSPGPNYKFTVVCSQGGGEIVSDSVQVVVKDNSDIIPRGDGDGTPGDGKNIQTYPTLYNTSTAKVVNFNVACGQLAAVWQAPQDVPEGYTLYYFDQRFNMWRELWNVRQGEVDTQVIGSELSYVKKFSPPNNDPTTLYRYRLHTYLGGTEFGPNSDATGSPLTTVWPCGTSFDMSNKDIVKVRDVDLPYSKFANQDSNVNDIVPILENDEITFRINILNSGELAFSGDISVVDQLTNLAEPKDGWKAKVDCGNKCRLSVDGYNPDTKQLAFTITPRARKTLAGGGVEVWAIEYTAKAKPAKIGNTAFLLQNKAFVNSSSSSLLTTKPLLVLPLGTAVFKEVQ